jgi:hypothetical protein
MQVINKVNIICYLPPQYDTLVVYISQILPASFELLQCILRGRPGHVSHNATTRLCVIVK